MNGLECVNCKCNFSEFPPKLTRFYHGNYYIFLCDTCLQEIPQYDKNPYEQSIIEQNKEIEKLRCALIEIKEAYNIKSNNVAQLEAALENTISKESVRIIKDTVPRVASFGITIIPSLAIDKDIIRCNGISFKLENLKEDK